MQIVYSNTHKAHFGQSELVDGAFQPSFECPERAEIILSTLRDNALGKVISPKDFGLAPIVSVHQPSYVDFIRGAWNRWTSEGNSFDMLPLVTPGRSRVNGREPTALAAQHGWFSTDMLTPITNGSWDAAYQSAQVALTAQKLVSNGDRAAYALCRPPGHHAGSAYSGGFCYLNNAAIVAEALRALGANRITILDVDYHHGNGTQDIFYERPDVQFVSLHADPSWEFPFYLGFADEKGAGPGEGYNLNYPLPRGVDWTAWSEPFEAACNAIDGYGPDFLVLSLGVDTFGGDPLSSFRLVSDDFKKIGERLKRLRRPTIFIQEGGYAVGDIGKNVFNVLSAFEG
ncbi:histone deacetylase family protein [Mesorhizobium kowhaii]|uniref:histone deacetylase family protein n=1 Tax=Mesorhizobium kowhaii TaxID=1300272 RepID=UPI0035E9C9DB